MSIRDRLVLTFATGFGFGYSPKAPGTVGTLWGLPLVWGMSFLQLNGWEWAVACLILFLPGGPICTRAGVLFGEHDPGAVVYDEIAAMPVVFLFTPVTPWTLLLSFLLFRLFDIAKPWPIKRLEKVPRGWGVMIDDTMAAIYAALCLWGLVQAIPGIST